MKDTIYYKQANLLLSILPLINRFPHFALKGGTAINFFVRNLPRLSVDIDLTYLLLHERETALADIMESLQALSVLISKRIPNVRITMKKAEREKRISALIINQKGITVKVEPNVVMRGTVFKPEKRTHCPSAQQLFERSVTSAMLSKADLYGGKICAALDRQHPRDFFDIYLLKQNEGFTEKIRKAFIVYLISHPRPMIELLDANPRDIKQVYEKEFRGMSIQNVGLNDLVKTQRELIRGLNSWLTDRERQFMLSVKKTEPDWNLSGIKGIEKLPAVQWKLLNLRKMSKAKHRAAIEKLQHYLES
ncbi:MAG TPA: nucleotidyl transferase AbiEii/AbiGii toxin family protein [bacterium]|mgnify:CR=1 FL=1|nr:nucleotidyl transferase AbiEii/AbiGii toxin family protein [bacterium]